MVRSARHFQQCPYSVRNREKKTSCRPRGTKRSKDRVVSEVHQVYSTLDKKLYTFGIGNVISRPHFFFAGGRDDIWKYIAMSNTEILRLARKKHDPDALCELAARCWAEWSVDAAITFARKAHLQHHLLGTHFYAYVLERYTNANGQEYDDWVRVIWERVARRCSQNEYALTWLADDYYASNELRYRVSKDNTCALKAIDIYRRLHEQFPKRASHILPIIHTYIHMIEHLDRLGQPSNDRYWSELAIWIRRYAKRYDGGCLSGTVARYARILYEQPEHWIPWGRRTSEHFAWYPTSVQQEVVTALLCFKRILAGRNDIIQHVLLPFLLTPSSRNPSTVIWLTWLSQMIAPFII